MVTGEKFSKIIFDNSKEPLPLHPQKNRANGMIP
jgi:hypothetical protein